MTKINSQIRAFTKLALLTKDYPSFESICVAKLSKSQKELGDKYTTQQAMEDLWWVWCETYPEQKDNLMNASKERLETITNFIKD